MSLTQQTWIRCARLGREVAAGYEHFLCVCKKLPNNFTINLQFSDYISLRDFLWIQCFLKGNKANGLCIVLVHDWLSWIAAMCSLGHCNVPKEDRFWACSLGLLPDKTLLFFKFFLIRYSWRTKQVGVALRTATLSYQRAFIRSVP